MVIQDLTTTISNPDFTQSIILGILVASAFPIGVAVAVAGKFPRRVKGNLAAIAAGIYFSTLAFSLIEEAIKISFFPAMAAGFVTGAVSFSIAHPLVKERKELTKILSRASVEHRVRFESTTSAMRIVDDRKNLFKAHASPIYYFTCIRSERSLRDDYMISKKKRSIRKYDSYLRSKNAVAQNKLIVALNASTGAAYEQWSQDVP